MTQKTHKNFWLGLTLAAGLLIIPPAHASEGGHGGHGGHGHEAAAAKSMTPAETLAAAIKGNDTFKGHHDAHYFDAYQEGQIPGLTVISCADSRVHTTLFGMDPNNNIFIIRNIGNQIGNSEGSVDYGVRHLPCKVLLVMGHSSCGAVKAAMGNYSRETDGIKKELDSLKAVIAKDDGKGAFKERWAKNVERNVDYQVKYACKLYSEKVENGEMAVVGAVYDFNNLYGKGRGSLVITNVNGETDPNKIMNDPLLQDLGNAELVNHVSSRAPTVRW
ncbi:MAG: carbonic anhydrase [Desulfobulbaceae bacterium]|nr:carbonic anhydrase [Desulfobulbaceae bacterium]